MIEGHDSPVTVLDAPLPPATRPAAPRGPRPPWWLWVAGVAVLLPVVGPLLYLFYDVARAGSSAWDTLFSGRTVELLAATSLLTAAVTVTATAIGIGTAWLTVRTDLPARRIWSMLIALPFVIPSYVVALTLLSAFGRDGLLTDILGPFGIDSMPSAAGSIGTWAALTISTYPFVHLIVSAALRRVDPAFEEAARGLGATSWRAFRSVVLPQLRPSAAAAALLVALYTVSDFGAVSLLRFDSFTRVIYAQYQGRLDRTPAAVLAVVLILVAAVILWVENRTRGRARYFSEKPKRVARPVQLAGRARVAALAFLSAIVTVSLILPIGVLATWAVRGLGRGQDIPVPWASAWGSLWVSAAAGAMAMVAAVPIAVLVVRYRSHATVALDRSVYGVFALPHITVALAMVFFAINFLGPLYQGYTLLILTYAAVFLPQASGAARAAMEQVNPHLEDAARGLGRGPLQTLLQITVPLIGKGVLAGGALVFLTTMKELPATLLLRPTGFDTLAVDVWSAAAEGLFAKAAVPALLLLAVSAVPVYLLVPRRYEH